MNYFKHIVFIIMFTLLLIPATIFAAAIPLSNVPIYLKSFSTSKYSFSTTASDGSFSIGGLEASGTYNMFVNDGSMPSIKMVAKDGVITGRVVVLTEGTTTQDPVPAKPIKKVAPKPVVKKPAATSTILKKISQ